MDNVETRLVKLARIGDRVAFNDLVNLYTDKIYHLGYRMLGNRQEAEDIVQETFLRVYMNIERFDATKKFSTWIYRIGTNLCIDRLRRRKFNYSLDARLSDEEEGKDWYEVLPSKDNLPEDVIVLTELQRYVRDQIEALPSKYKTIVVLRYLHGMSLKEIGEILDMPVTTIKTRVHRGRQYLKRKLDKDKYFKS